MDLAQAIKEFNDEEIIEFAEASQLSEGIILLCKSIDDASEWAGVGLAATESATKEGAVLIRAELQDQEVFKHGEKGRDFNSSVG